MLYCTRSTTGSAITIVSFSYNTQNENGHSSNITSYNHLCPAVQCQAAHKPLDGKGLLRARRSRARLPYPPYI